MESTFNNDRRIMSIVGDGFDLSPGSDFTATESATGSSGANLKSSYEDDALFKLSVSTNASSDRASKKLGAIVRENGGSKGEAIPSIEGRQDGSASASSRTSRSCGGVAQEPRPSENGDEITGIEHPVVHLLEDMATSSSVHMNDQEISRSNVTPQDRLPVEIVHEQFASNVFTGADVTTFAHPQVVFDEVKQSPLDLKAAFLPLIPSFPVGSAEIRVWIRSVTITSGVMLAKPPYVRVSLHPDAHRVTCTGLSRCPTPATLTSDPTSSRERNAKTYLFEKDGASNWPLALRLGVEGARQLSQGYGLPIMLRLQAVSSRLLGSCDVSLLEALRRPGSVFRQVSMPIRRTMSKGWSRQLKRSISITNTQHFKGQQYTPREAQTDRVISGYVVFDFGVMLTQEENKIPAPKLDRTRAILHAGIVKVSVIGLRGSLASGSDLGGVNAQCAGILSVSAELASSSQNKTVAFDVIRPGSQRRHLLPSAAVPGLRCADASLVSTCMELDTLILRLIHLEELGATGRWIGRYGAVTSRDQERVLGSHLPIPISDISTLFDGGAHWLQMSSHESSHRKRKIRDKSMVSTTDTAGRNGWKVCLRVAVSNEIPADQLRLHEGTGPEQASPRFPSTLNISQCSVRCTESTYLNCEAWMLAQRRGPEQAQAVLSSRPERQSQHDEIVMADTDVRSGSIQGPGYLNLELLAIHGSFVEAEVRNGMVGDMKSPRFWVRASFSGGSDGLKIVDSSDLILGIRCDGQGAGRDVSGGNHEITRWPLGTVMAIKYALHWTPRQSVLPMASFSLFQGENSIAHSTLDLAPIIMHGKRDGQQGKRQYMYFLHPCGRTLREGGKNLTASLEIKCSFASESGESEYRSLPSAVPRTHAIYTMQNAGILCIQVLDVRRLHRVTRSQLRLPLSVVFSLPHVAGIDRYITNNDGLIGENCSDESCPDQRRQASVEARFGSNSGSSQNGDDWASLRVESCRRGSIMVLAALLGANVAGAGGYQRRCSFKRDASDDDQHIVGAIWFPVGDDVMRDGHLSDRWYPFRVIDGTRSYHPGNRACEIRLRLHFIPDLPAKVVNRIDGSSTRRYGRGGADEYIMVALEEGRDLTHPHLPGGPRELFAEVFVDDGALAGSGEHCGDVEFPTEDCCSAEQQPEKITGPLPAAQAAAYGSGACPCWNHMLRVPLRLGMRCTAECAWDGDGRRRPTSPLLIVIIKSAARRVVSRIPSPIPLGLLEASAGNTPRETRVERCLVVGTARIRLPSDILRQEHGRKFLPVRGWYAVRDDCGAHRGKVKLSIFTPSRVGQISAIDERQQPSTSKRFVTDLNGSIDRRRIKSDVKPGEKWDQATVGFGRAKSNGSISLEQKGLLIISIDDITLRSGDGDQLLGLSAVTDASASIRYSRKTADDRAHGSTGATFDAPSGKRHFPIAAMAAYPNMVNIDFEGGDVVDSISTPPSSAQQDFYAFSTEGTWDAKTAKFLPVYAGGVKDDAAACSSGDALEAVLDISQHQHELKSEVFLRVSVKLPHQCVTIYHGVLSLPSYFLPALHGEAIQERKILMNADQVSTHEGHTGGQSIGQELAEENFCAVNVTTSFIPHMSGVLNVVPSQLRLAPPSPQEIDRLRVLTELRERTESSAAAQSSCAAYQFPRGNSSEDNGIRVRLKPCNASNVFLRMRILPSGPWAFTPIFRMTHPRPADWGRDPMNAGTTIFPRKKTMALALNTELHTRGAQPLTDLEYFPPFAPSSDPGNGSMVTILERLSLEVCLFDNSTSSSRYLLGRGILPLTPAIVTGHPGQAEICGSSRLPIRNFHDMSKEVILFEPVTGNIMSTVYLGMTFMGELEASSAPAVMDNTMTSSVAWYPRKMDHVVERITSHTSLAIWTLKAVFYTLAPQNNKVIRLDSVLAHLANSNWLEETLASDSVRSKPLELSHAPRSQDRDAMEGDEGGDRRFGGEFSPHVCRLLAPQGVKRDSLVPWEVWASFCEIVCQAPDLSHISAAFVWKRAAKVRPQPISFSDNFFRHGETPRLFSPTEWRVHIEQDAHINNAQAGSIGCRGSKLSAFCPSFADGEPYEMDIIAGGYGDIVLSDEDSVLTEDAGESPPAERLLIGTDASSYPSSIRGRNRRHTNVHTSRQIASSERRCRRSPINRIRWSLPHGPSDSEALGWKSFRAMSAGEARRGHRSSTDIPVGRFARSSPSIAVIWPCRAPVTEELPMGAPSANDTVEYCGDRQDGQIKSCKGKEALDTAVYEGINHGEAISSVKSCLQQEVSVRGNTSGQHHAHVKSAVNTRPFILRSLSVATAWEKNKNEFDLEMVCREAQSAKRKASKYKAFIAETQHALERERRKAGVLESRALEGEAKLLQRDRARTLQAVHDRWDQEGKSQGGNKGTEAGKQIASKDRSTSAIDRTSQRDLSKASDVLDLLPARARLLKHQEERARLQQRSMAQKLKIKAEVAAAAMLQRIARGYIERLRYKVAVQRIKVLQRACKYLLEDRRRHRRRVLYGQAALSLQKTWRGRLERRRLAECSALTTKAQALVRGFLCRERVRGSLELHWRRREAAAIAIQKRRRMAVMLRDYVALRAATVIVQGSYRRRRALQEFIRRKHAAGVLQRAGRRCAFNARRRRVASLLQLSYRSRVRIKKARLERKAMLFAARVLQGAVRRWVQRRLLRRTLEAQRRDRAAASLHRSIKMYLERKKLYYSRFISTVLTHQRAVEKHSANLSKVRKRRKDEAATKIQSAYRGQRSRSHSSFVLRQRNVSAIKIQSFFREQRGRRAEKHRQIRWRQERSALVVQRTWKRKRGLVRAASAVTALRKVTGDIHMTGYHEKTEQMATLLTRQQLQTHERCIRAQNSNLQEAVQTVASGMVALEAIDAIDAQNLKHLLDLNGDDPKLQGALRETLVKLEMSCFVDQRLEWQGRSETGIYANKVGDGVARSLQQSLTVLEMGLPAHPRK